MNAELSRSQRQILFARAFQWFTLGALMAGGAVLMGFWYGLDNAVVYAVSVAAGATVGRLIGVWWWNRWQRRR